MLLAMVMSVIVAMIGAEGLGLVVLQGLGRLDIGRAAVGGIGIVLLAIMLDRITQAVAHMHRTGRGTTLFASVRNLVVPGRPGAEVGIHGHPRPENG